MTTERILQLPCRTRPNTDAPILGGGRETRTNRVPKETEANMSASRSIRRRVKFRGAVDSGAEVLIGFSATNNVRAGAVSQCDRLIGAERTNRV